MLSKIKEFAKKNVFNFILACLIICGMGVDIIQSGGMLALKDQMKQHTIDMKQSMRDHREDVAGSLRSTSDVLGKRMERLSLEINARVDTIDSTIDPKEKRKSLVAKIRNAITENTKTKLDIRTLNRIANAALDYSYEFNLPPAMVLAQIKQESDFKHKVVSHAEAQGLMQIIPPTADEIAGKLGIRSYKIFDIRTNIRFGCFYMAEMLHRNKNDYDYALRSYNFGHHRMLEVKNGNRDYSRSKVVVDEDGAETQYLIDKYGEFELDDEGNRIVVQEEHRYPRETRLYVKLNNKYRKIFSTYGLDVEE